MLRTRGSDSTWTKNVANGASAKYWMLRRYTRRAARVVCCSWAETVGWSRIEAGTISRLGGMSLAVSAERMR